MKIQKLTLFITLLLVLPFGAIHGQSEKSQAFWVHEDVVKPSMIAEYEAVCSEFTANLKKHNIPEMDFIVTNTNDNRYLWVGPIDNMAQLDKPIFTTLVEKMGEQAFEALFERMNKCYDIEHDYILNLDRELSYMPGGMTQTPEGQNYRKFHYFNYAPADVDKVRAQSKAIKELFERKGSKMEYRVYRSGFGNRGEYLMVAIAAESAKDYASKIESNNELLGEEWLETYNAFLGMMIKVESVEGRMRPEFAYSQK